MSDVSRVTVQKVSYSHGHHQMVGNLFLLLGSATKKYAALALVRSISGVSTVTAYLVSRRFKGSRSGAPSTRSAVTSCGRFGRDESRREVMTAVVESERRDRRCDASQEGAPRRLDVLERCPVHTGKHERVGSGIVWRTPFAQHREGRLNQGNVSCLSAFRAFAAHRESRRDQIDVAPAELKQLAAA
jgi:hypothetical protein